MPATIRHWAAAARGGHRARRLPGGAGRSPAIGAAAADLAARDGGPPCSLASPCRAGLLVELLKDWIGRLRPDDQEHMLVAVQSYAFPSGHAANATVVWLVPGLAARARSARPPARHLAPRSCWRWRSGSAGHARRPLAERRRRRLGVRPVLDPGAVPLGASRRSTLPEDDRQIVGRHLDHGLEPEAVRLGFARPRPRGRAAPHSGSRAFRLASNASLLGAVSTPAWR